ncbi:MAG: polyprenyl synthetase family protein [Anaerolineae bacterium]|nr:polyprenyl synthetase family protein [Anaerolineae bacterium]MCO5203550.1 polyprenyl synthetase family protein [Anaerolineae bacterium]
MLHALLVFPMLSAELLRAYIADIPEITEWPDIADRLNTAFAMTDHDWRLPLRACLAVGGSAEQAIPGCIAIAASQMSIIVVDDMLDNEPDGYHAQAGAGVASNAALALLALALRVIDKAEIPAERKASIMQSIAQMNLRTAYGQHLDVQNLTGEDNYWRVTATKSTPFYGCAYETGALLGGADVKLAATLYEIGVILGELIQIEDDLTDALETPANSDWNEERNNLLIMYASTADHAERAQFRQLRTCFNDPACLDAAQQILVRSGAVSYALYNIIVRNQTILTRLHALPLAEPHHLTQLNTYYAERLSDMLARNGISISAETIAATSVT